MDQSICLVYPESGVIDWKMKTDANVMKMTNKQISLKCRILNFMRKYLMSHLQF